MTKLISVSASFLAIWGWSIAISYTKRLTYVNSAIVIALATFAAFVALRLADITRNVGLRQRFSAELLKQGLWCSVFALALLMPARLLPSWVTPFMIIAGAGVVLLKLKGFSKVTLAVIGLALGGAAIFQLGVIEVLPHGTLIGWIVFAAAFAMLVILRERGFPTKSSG